MVHRLRWKGEIPSRLLRQHKQQKGTGEYGADREMKAQRNNSVFTKCILQACTRRAHSAFVHLLTHLGSAARRTSAATRFPPASTPYSPPPWSTQSPPSSPSPCRAPPLAPRLFASRSSRVALRARCATSCCGPARAPLTWLASTPSSVAFATRYLTLATARHRARLDAARMMRRMVRERCCAMMPQLVA